CQVSHYQNRRQCAGQGVFLGKLTQVFKREPEPIYAGFDMQGTGTANILVPAIGFPNGDVAGRVQHWNETRFTISSRGLGPIEAVEDEYLRVGKNLSQENAFLRKRDKEGAAAFFPKGICHRLNTYPIAVSLDHACRLRRMRH